MDPKSIPHRIQIISKLPKLHSTFKSSKIFQLRTLKFPQHHLNLHQTISNKSPNLKLHLEFPISTIFSSILENSFSSYLIKLHRSFDKISDEQKNIFPRKKKRKKIFCENIAACSGATGKLAPHPRRFWIPSVPMPEA